MSRLTDPLLGHQIGSYVLQDLLGEGGMARVYLGRHHEHGSYAAIKVIEADRFSTAAEAERFRREGRNMFRLRHRNIVKFLEFGVVEDLYFLVVEFIDGADLGWILRQYGLRNKLMPLQDSIEIARQVGEALDYIHGKGTVHRDVKPSNILIRRNGRALLTDFGLALSAWESTYGAAFGSALYVSPEQAAYSGNAVPQSDVYSFGAVLYEMITGSPPFEAETLMAIVLKHINESPAPPSSIERALDPALDEAVLKALAKDPNERYPSAGEFVQALIDSQQAAAALRSEGVEGEHGAAPDQNVYGLPVSEVVEARPAVLPEGGGRPYLPSRRSRLTRPIRRWGVLPAAILTGTLCAAVAVAGPRSGELWSRLRPESEPAGGAAEVESDRSPQEAQESGAPEAAFEHAGAIMRSVSCSGIPIVSRLEPGMYTYATRTTPLYDTPRTEHNEAIGQFIQVLQELEPGDRMLVLDHESYPNCFGEAYFLKVRTDDGVEGWVHEWLWHYYLRP